MEIKIFKQNFTQSCTSIGINFCLVFIFLVGLGSSKSYCQNVQEFEKKVTVYTLPNGLKCIFIKRDVAPVASFVTYVNAGSSDDPTGYNGLAHLFEHMAFKGSRTIGTTQYEKEKPWIEAQDAAYTQWLAETKKNNPDSVAIKQAWQNFKQAESECKKFVVNNEFGTLVEKNGGQDLNAYTTNDQTVYYYSLPENKAELWFALESDRFNDAVLREFYTEKEVVKEERRMRVENNPYGKLLEEFNSVALSGHPYGIRGIGNNSTLDNCTIAKALAFFDTYYTPNNMAIAIAGDIDPDKMKHFAETYFGRLKTGNSLPQNTFELTPQRGERRIVLNDVTQPIYLEGYRTVKGTHPDDDALQILSAILTDGRLSRLYKRLVEKDQKATDVSSRQGYPGKKYAGLFTIEATPTQGANLDEIEKAIAEEIADIQEDGIGTDELARVVTKLRADLVRSLDNNQSLAIRLVQNEMLKGSWKALFTSIEKMQKLTPADIQRVAQKYFVKSNHTVAVLQTTTK